MVVGNHFPSKRRLWYSSRCHVDLVVSRTIRRLLERMKRWRCWQKLKISALIINDSRRRLGQFPRIFSYRWFASTEYVQNKRLFNFLRDLIQIACCEVCNKNSSTLLSSHDKEEKLFPFQNWQEIINFRIHRVLSLVIHVGASHRVPIIIFIFAFMSNQHETLKTCEKKFLLFFSVNCGKNSTLHFRRWNFDFFFISWSRCFSLEMKVESMHTVRKQDEVKEGRRLRG